MKDKEIIGLTGGIASGKSTVINYCLQHGYTIFSADLIARQLTKKHSPCWQKIVTHFGREILDADEELNRKKLREIIFNCPTEKKIIENILHPEIQAELNKLVSKSLAKKILIEIPLLKNKQKYPYLTKIIYISTSLTHQAERIIERDHCPKEQALAIIRNQPSHEDYRQIADEVILNDGSIDELYLKLAKILL